jgi:ketosteroid isomerase-like protein
MTVDQPSLCPAMDQAHTDRLALRGLAEAYASACDTRDDDAFVALFTPDATLTIDQEGRRLGAFDGPDGLRAATAPLDGYRATMHFVGNHTCAIDGDRATGTTYCLANHLRPAGGDAVENLRMVIRYDDTYARGADGRWRFTARDLTILWTEAVPADVAPLAF